MALLDLGVDITLWEGAVAEKRFNVRISNLPQNVNPKPTFTAFCIIFAVPMLPM